MSREAMQQALEAMQQVHGDYHLMPGRVGPKEAFAMMRDAIAALRAALAEQAQPVSPGWRLVPVEPTQEMTEAGATSINDNGGNARWSDIREAWADMLAAAPEAPAPVVPQPDRALRWATQLAESLARKHYPEVPQFEPLPDLVGVISQIDNMTCGLTRLPAPQPCIFPACQCRYEDTPNGRIRFCELAGKR